MFEILFYNFFANKNLIFISNYYLLKYTAFTLFVKKLSFVAFLFECRADKILFSF